MQLNSAARLRMCVIFLSALLTACAANVTSVDDAQPTETRDDMGYLVLGIDERSRFRSILMHGEDTVRITADSLIEGSNFIVYPLEAGDYNFDSFYLSSSFKVRLDSENWQVKIEPNKLTYVGHINVSMLGLFSGAAIQLNNRSSEALAFLSSNYPKLLSQFEVAYGGPGDDPYMSYVATLSNATPISNQTEQTEQTEQADQAEQAEQIEQIEQAEVSQ